MVYQIISLCFFNKRLEIVSPLHAHVLGARSGKTRKHIETLLLLTETGRCSRLRYLSLEMYLIGGADVLLLTESHKASTDNLLSVNDGTEEPYARIGHERILVCHNLNS